MFTSLDRLKWCEISHPTWTATRMQNTKKPKKRLSPYYYACMIAGIIAMTYLADWGDTPLAAGLECGAGAALGSLVFYIGRYLLFAGSKIDKTKAEQK